MVRIEIQHTIDQIAAAPWNELCQVQPFARQRWLRLLEATLAYYEPRYALVWQGERLVAAAICNLQRNFHLSIYLPNPLLRKIAERFLATFPPLTCTVPVYTCSGLILSPAIDPAQGMGWLLQAIKQVARQERSLLVGWNDLDPPTHHLLTQTARTAAVVLPPESYLPILWDSYEAYQAALPKKQRAEIRRVRNRAQEAGVCLSTSELKPEYESRIEQLIQTVAARHGNHYLYRPNLLQRASAVLCPDDYRLLLAWHEGEIIGCLNLLHSGNDLLVKWVGLDYPRTEPTLAYHYLMTETVAQAIAMGAKRLVLGVTTYTLKKKMGATLEPRAAALQLQNHPLNYLFTRFMGWRQSRPRPAEDHDGVDSD